jgi:hypothetical protein
MKNHTELLNHIAAKIGAVTYVEIGVFNPDHNFNKIKVPTKFGVDPDPNARATFKGTSDEFFKNLKAVHGRVDLYWIDGLHYWEQVRRDIENAWACLEPGGVIALHDTNPPTEVTTCIPRGRQREWCGDTYKAICALSYPGPGPYFFTANFDYGCTVIRKPHGRSQSVAFADIPEVAWSDFNDDRATWINLLPVTQALEFINAWT